MKRFQAEARVCFSFSTGVLTIIIHRAPSACQGSSRDGCAKHETVFACVFEVGNDLWALRKEI